ncbi:MAG: hypothetical protein Q9209_000838 [Squamulea sp. 1 TL-2023]
MTSLASKICCVRFRMATIVIAKDGDLTIQVVEFDDKIRDEDDKPVVSKTQDFLVSREILATNSSHFAILLRTNIFSEARKDRITLQDDSIKSMQIWFETFHAITPTHAVGIEEMWHLSAAGNKYRLDMTRLEAWFTSWYRLQPVDEWYKAHQQGLTVVKKVPEPRSLMYPCWIFNHHLGFKRITEYAAYNYTGHIVEVNPTEHKNLHLPPRVIQQLNHAKGRLRTIIHRELYKPIDRLLEAKCSCKEHTLFNYEKALTIAEVWPLEKNAQHTSMHDLMDRLDDFHFKVKPGACYSCRNDYEELVEEARDLTLAYFDGLCLDCIDESKAKDGDAEYWRHSKYRRPRETDMISCNKGKHTQSCWYYSYIGRKERKDPHQWSRYLPRFDGDSE